MSKVKFVPNKFGARIRADYALFTDPLTKISGEKCSMQIPSVEALEGIIKSCYWKPTIEIAIDRFRIMNPIRMESKGIRPIGYFSDATENDLTRYIYLQNPEYQVEFHIEFNNAHPELKADRNIGKHCNMMRKALLKGGRRDIFLGTRECQGYIEPVIFGEGESYYDGIDMNFGIQYHTFAYPDETKRNAIITRYWNPQMRNGIIHVCEPKDCLFETEAFMKKENVIYIDRVNFRSADEEERIWDS